MALARHPRLADLAEEGRRGQPAQVTRVVGELVGHREREDGRAHRPLGVVVGRARNGGGEERGGGLAGEGDQLLADAA